MTQLKSINGCVLKQAQIHLAELLTVAMPSVYILVLYTI